MGWIMLGVGGIWFHFYKGFSLLLLFSIYMYEDLLGSGTCHSCSFLGLEQQTLPKKYDSVFVGHDLASHG